MKPLVFFYRFCSSYMIPFLPSKGCRILCLIAFILLLNNAAFAQYELPVPTPPTQNQLIKSGSLIIPMDTVYQYNPGYFNLKSYGLVNALLQNEIPVMWAIKAAKTRTALGSIDFIANVKRVFPDTSSAANDTLRCGPFIIDSIWVSRALPIISAYGNNVVVFKLNTGTTIDIRYTLTFKPHLILLNGGGYDTITVHQLTEAGFTSGSYNMQTMGQVFTPTTGYSLASDQHATPGDGLHVNPVVNYVNQFGGNLITNCAAIGAYENYGLFFTTGGIDSLSTSGTISYSNHNLPIAQFLGNLGSTYGEFRFWKVKTASAFKTTTYHLVKGATTTYIISANKLRPNGEKGSNVFCLPGHDYFAYASGGSNQNIRINGRRVFLNSIFIPPNDSTHLDFITDVSLSMTPQAGLAVKNESFLITFIATNVGHWRARNVSVQAPLPPGLIYQSHVCGGGSYNSGTGVWSLDSLAIGRSDTLRLTVTIGQLGNIFYTGTAVNQSLEYVLGNNSVTINLFGVSRPNAIDDTVYFSSPLYQDINSKGNDTDEDGGPFGNTQILAGPYHGTATVTNGDTIRYTLGAGFAGVDSIQYVTCDQYPLCDTAWVLITIASPLPVTLVRFEGKRINSDVNLHWITLSEKNNDYFSIERCTDNTSFDSRGRVKGAGNSNMLKDYYFTDSDNNDPVYYYRLRQFDFNGQAHLSPVIALSRKDENKVSFKLIPNPVGKSEQLLAVFNGLQQGESVLRIADMTGRVIIKKNLTISEGNQLDFVSINETIETGCYMVTLITPFETISSRLVIQ